MEAWSLLDSFAANRPPSPGPAGDYDKCCAAPNLRRQGHHMLACQTCGAVRACELGSSVTCEDEFSPTSTRLNELYPVASMATRVRAGSRVASDPAKFVMATCNRGGMPYEERRLFTIVSDFTVRMQALSVPEKISSCAVATYRRVFDLTKPRGDAKRSVLAACLYCAFNGCGHARSTHEVAQLLAVPVANINKYIPIVDSVSPTSHMEPTVMNHVPRLCYILELDDDDTETCLRVARRVAARVLAGRTFPCTTHALAGGAILWALSDVSVRGFVRRVADACGVTTVTIRKARKCVSEDLGVLSKMSAT